jgi:hypothetical protein
MYEYRLQVDIPEPRPAQGRLAIGYDGTMLAQGFRTSGIWIDPCTLTAMLKPLPLTELWATSYTGNYARFDPNAAYTIPTPSKWERIQIRAAGDFFLRAKQATDEIVQVTTAFVKNQPVFLTWYKPEVKIMADAPVLRLYWNYQSATTSGELKLVFYANGKCEIYKNGLLVNTYDRQGSNFAPGSGYVATYSTNQQFNDILIIPYRRRELLVHTNYGLSFSHVFTDLDETLTTNDITPAGKFAFSVPTGKAAVQVAKCLFSQSGTFIASQQVLRYAPPTTVAGPPVYPLFTYETYSDVCGPNIGDTLTTSTSLVWEDPAVADWQSWPTVDNGTTSLWNGIKKTVRMKVSLSNNTRVQTPTIYGVEAFWDPYPVQTYNGIVDVSSAVKSLNVEVNEDGRAIMTASFWSSLMATAGVIQPEVTSDRPFRLQVKTRDTAPAVYCDIMIGTLDSPKINRMDNDTANRWSTYDFQGNDRSSDFDITMVQATPALDDYPLGNAIRNLVRLCGYVDDGGAYDNCSIFIANDGSPTEFVLPFTTNASKGEWTWTVERGETVGGALDRLQSDFASTWVKGWFPNSNNAGGYTYSWETPNTAPTAADVTLWPTVEAANNPQQGNLTMPYASFCVYRSLNIWTEPAECNSVVVVGRDPRRGQIIYGYFQDGPSQDATLAPASRPLNWRGRPVHYILTDPSLTSQSKVSYATGILQNRLTVNRQMIEVSSDMLIRNLGAAEDQRPIWINDTIKIMAQSSYTVTFGATTTIVNGTFTGGSPLAFGMQVAFYTTGTLPAAITAGTLYYIVGLTTSVITVSATAGGTPITFATAGTGVHTLFPVYGWFRVIAIPQMEFVVDGSNRVPVRNCTYRCERTNPPA